LSSIQGPYILRGVIAADGSAKGATDSTGYQGVMCLLIWLPALPINVILFQIHIVGGHCSDPCSVSVLQSLGGDSISCAPLSLWQKVQFMTNVGLQLVYLGLLPALLLCSPRVMTRNEVLFPSALRVCRCMSRLSLQASPTGSGNVSPLGGSASESPSSLVRLVEKTHSGLDLSHVYVSL
jgi:hypothetical protein